VLVSPFIPVFEKVINYPNFFILAQSIFGIGKARLNKRKGE